ncbi:DUF2946 domain-containing protein [Agrobacterium tumefaciens]|uniref:DUF2946 domain-containing protein n=1 Tax=Agrobacterium tumefaciens TaxID=358 RepID=UPI0021CF3C19|nr:DUF2946 domain-containing protein [Agrobacterium tumefaciens]
MGTLIARMQGADDCAALRRQPGITFVAVTSEEEYGTSQAMRFIRKIMQDRSSAGAIATLALLLFLLQGLVNGAANGSMAAAALAAGDVICSTHSPDGATGKENPASKLANNCCGALCRLASLSTAALPVTPDDLPADIIPKVQIAVLPADAALPPSPPNRDSRARAPPLSLQI